MANLIVFKNYNITDNTKWYNDRTNERGLKNHYNAMEEIAIASAKEFVQDYDEIIVHRGESENIRDVFKDHYFEMLKLWEQGHNVLYVDLDVVFTNPIKYFSEYNTFRMFNYTDPKSVYSKYYDLKLPNYFNCAIRYHPASMSQECWDLGNKMVANWDPEQWDTEQIIFNAMMWSQGLTLADVYQPELNYQFLNSIESTIKFNALDMIDAKAIHTCGSRGSKIRLQLMQQIRDKTTKRI